MSVAAPTTVPQPRSGIPGHYVVIGMFVVGIAATATIFTYWDLHTRPFRPLIETLGREFPTSIPKVEGGRHKGGPMTLRIAMRVPFVPSKDEAETQRMVNRVVELTRTTPNPRYKLADFEVLQLYLLQIAPQEKAKQQLFELPAKELATQLPFPDAN